MGGPIVRSGPSPEFTKNWDSVFAGKKKPAANKPAAKAAEPKAKAGKKAATKTAKKTVKKAKKK